MTVRNLSESYEGLAADTWDLFGGNQPEDDLEYYASAIKVGGGPALDVTCGSGKHLLPYLQRGLEVEGLDASETLLKSCRERGAAIGLMPVLYCQKMQEMALPRKYCTIFISVGSFQLLTDPRDAAVTLRKCREHLQRGGRLYITAFKPEEAFNPTHRTRQTWGPLIRPTDGAEITIRRWTESVDYTHRTLIERREYVVKLRGTVVKEEAAMLFLRWYEIDELTAMLSAVGFAEVFAHTAFTDMPAAKTYTEIVIGGTVL